MVVVKADGNPTLCKTDEVGELCLSAPYCGTGYWGLQGVSNAAFKVGNFQTQLHPNPWYFFAVLAVSKFVM